MGEGKNAHTSPTHPPLEGVGYERGSTSSIDATRDSRYPFHMNSQQAREQADFNNRRAPSSSTRAANRTRSARMAAKSASENPPARLRVLLVDDQPSTLLLMRAIFERAGYHVVDCLSGRAAVDLLSTSHFDLMILDVNLSDMSGMELLQSSGLASTSLPPVLGITASPTPALVEQAEQAGMCGLLPKPISYEQLIEAAKVAIEVGGARHVACRGPALDPVILSQISATSDERLIHRFVHQALADARGSLQNLGAATASHDLATWRQHAQALDGIALTLGARRLASAIAAAIALPPRRLAQTANALTKQFTELLDEAKQSLLEQLGLLSDRERSCLRLLGEGLPVKQIAHELAITDRTVRFHLSNAAAKLGARGQAQAVAKALKLGAI
jgi:DNA-binding NarL/FixJ family response regulator